MAASPVEIMTVEEYREFWSGFVPDSYVFRELNQMTWARYILTLTEGSGAACAELGEMEQWCAANCQGSFFRLNATTIVFELERDVVLCRTFLG